MEGHCVGARRRRAGQLAASRGRRLGARGAGIELRRAPDVVPRRDPELRAVECDRLVELPREHRRLGGVGDELRMVIEGAAEHLLAAVGVGGAEEDVLVPDHVDQAWGGHGEVRDQPEMDELLVLGDHAQRERAGAAMLSRDLPGEGPGPWIGLSERRGDVVAPARGDEVLEPVAAQPEPELFLHGGKVASGCRSSPDHERPQQAIRSPGRNAFTDRTVDTSVESGRC
ncbi:MAG: hypothetical protein JWL60_924 [Gemmatimonadetes bacterium]|nr:hypothetical protein [Gemmatimonadota bacterium]